MKAQTDSPYVFFATRKSEQGKPPRLFVSWVHEAVLADMAISYVVVCYDEQKQIRGLDVRYQESYEDPYRAGVEFAELKEYAPAPPDAPGTDPADRRDLLEMKISHQQSHQRWLVEEADEDLRIILGEDR